jgi:hypothetical protein
MRRLVSDIAILATWTHTAIWALENLEVCSRTTLDAIVAVDSTQFLHSFLSRFEDLEDLQWRRMVRFNNDGGVYRSPLDIAASHGNLRVIKQLFAMNFPGLCSQATLGPCIQSGNLTVLKWISKKVGLSHFFSIGRTDCDGNDSRSMSIYSTFFRDLGESGTPDAWDDIIIYLTHNWPHDMRSLVLSHAAFSGNIAMLRHLLFNYDGTESVNLFASAIHGNQPDVLQSLWQWTQAHPAIDIGQFAGDSMLYWGLPFPKIVAFVHSNISPLQIGHLNRAAESCRLETIEWIIENTPLSLVDTILPPRSIGWCPICLFWYIKRGGRISFSFLTRLVLRAGQNPDIFYPFELWLADTICDRFFAQIITTNGEDLEFYSTTAELPLARGWSWGFERGIKFPTTAERWMYRPSLHPSCGMILDSIFGQVALTPIPQSPLSLLRRFE